MGIVVFFLVSTELVYINLFSQLNQVRFTIMGQSL